MILDRYKYVYFIGIGGIGMSALARYFNTIGKRVYGYDKEQSVLCSQLELEGIDIHYIAHEDYIPSIIKTSNSNELLVIYTPAIAEDNLELNFFLKKKFNLYKRSEILAIISSQLFTIAIAGTHGKTTTSAILAHILHSLGKASTAFIGGISKNYNTNLIFSVDASILIVEADEYDRSFLSLKPDIAIITSVDADHMDIYKTKESLQNAFLEFALQIKKQGVLFVESSIDLEFPIPLDGKKLTYSSNEKADFYSSNIEVSNGSMTFDILFKEIHVEKKLFHKERDINLVMPGKHNISNAVVASAVAYYLGANTKQIRDSINTFKGIERRYELLINNSKLIFIDDYAHHPEEVSSTINTTKKLFPKRDITVVFQPHLFSRTQDFAQEFAVSLSLADQLILLDIYPAREKPIIGVDSKMLLNLCTNPKKEICSKKELLKTLEFKELDVLLTLGAGDIGRMAQPIKHMLN